MSMIHIDTGPKWLDTGKHKPDSPGCYWGVFVVVRPTYRLFEWDGNKWKGEEDDGEPFYFWPERLPRPTWPLDDATAADIERQIRKITRKE